jgi:prevent-host-death family protein
MATHDEPVEVSASDLKNAWHEFLDRVSRGRQEVVVTRYGKPIARLIPYQAPDEGGGIFGCLAGSVTVHGDIIVPVAETWEADA